MKLVMIGHGMVGHKFIEAILEKADDELEITILAEEPRIAYDRVHLTEYFSGKSAKDLSLARFDFADAHGIDLRLNTKATALIQLHKQSQPIMVMSSAMTNWCWQLVRMHSFHQFRVMTVKTALFTVRLKT